MKSVRVTLTVAKLAEQASTIRQMVRDFADAVYRRFPPGTAVRFTYRPPTSPGLAERPTEIGDGRIAKIQANPCELPEYGLLVETTERVLAQLPAWRKVHLHGQLLLRVWFTEIVDESKS
jgi:hypothetical protein